MLRSFRARLSITVLLLLALSLGVMGAWLAAEFRIFYMVRVEESLVRQARLVELLVRDSPSAPSWRFRQCTDYFSVARWSSLGRISSRGRKLG